MFSTLAHAFLNYLLKEIKAQSFKPNICMIGPDKSFRLKVRN